MTMLTALIFIPLWSGVCYAYGVYVGWKMR